MRYATAIGTMSYAFRRLLGAAATVTQLGGARQLGLTGVTLKETASQAELEAGR